MIETQKLLSVGLSELLEKVLEFKKQGYRLVQIGCTQTTEGLELNYSFDKEYFFINLRLALKNEIVPSVSEVYWNAFLYENEIHDLFGVSFSGMAIDYQGNFYRMSLKKPFLNIPQGGADKPKGESA